MNKNQIMWAILTIFLSFIFCQDVFSWDNVKTHRDLSSIAADNSVLSAGKGDYLKKIGINLGLNETLKFGGLTKTAKQWIQEGAYLEDAGSYLDAINGKARFNNHFHNPLKTWSAAGLSDLQNGESALVWAQDSAKQSVALGGDWSWKTIRDFFYKALTSTTDTERQAYFARTFQGLGYQMHLIQDMSVPAHVRNDAHPEDAIMGKNYWTGDYYFEKWANKNYVTINSFASNAFLPHVALNISRSGYTPITQLIDSEQYGGTNPSISLAWGLAEYVNANYASSDTIFTEDFAQNNKHYFPYPRYSTESYEMYEENYSIFKKRIYLRKTGDGEQLEHFATTGPLFKYLSFDPALQKRELKTDNKVHRDSAEKLIPRAVGYSAGLLNYFFRGEIDLIPDEKIGSGYVIVNNTDEDMSGAFELFYDNKNDERIKLKSWSLSIGRKSSGSNKGANISFAPPNDAKEPCKYILVFKGRLGQEDGAVATRTVKAMECVTGKFIQASGNAVRVYTEKGIITRNIANDIANIININAIRFNLSNPNEFMVLAMISRPYPEPSYQELHKYEIDELNMGTNYAGKVFSSQSMQHWTVEETPLCPTSKLQEKNTIIYMFVDFYWDGGAPKLFGYYRKGKIQTIWIDWDGWWYSPAIIYQHVTEGIYYGQEMYSQTVETSGGWYGTDEYCRVLYNEASPLYPPDIKPVAIFNKDDFAYTIGYPQGKTVSPVPLENFEWRRVKSMLRKDSGHSCSYENRPYIDKYISYLSELGTLRNVAVLLSADNPYKKNIGWSSDGQIVECNIINEQLSCRTLKSIGGSFSFSSPFDMILEFSE